MKSCKITDPAFQMCPAKIFVGSFPALIEISDEISNAACACLVKYQPAILGYPTIQNKTRNKKRFEPTVFILPN
ncbi:hypothetical protein G9P44_005843 [Scheffersomyces stipitis]|nr:hypothetical protein G9P44_005843 [Scheffersomyces stipitis]